MSCSHTRLPSFFLRFHYQCSRLGIIASDMTICYREIRTAGKHQRLVRIRALKRLAGQPTEVRSKLPLHALSNLGCPCGQLRDLWKSLAVSLLSRSAIFSDSTLYSMQEQAITCQYIVVADHIGNTGLGTLASCFSIYSTEAA